MHWSPTPSWRQDPTKRVHRCLPMHNATTLHEAPWQPPHAPCCSPWQDFLWLPMRSRSTNFPQTIMSAAVLASLSHTRQARQQLGQDWSFMFLPHQRLHACRGRVRQTVLRLLKAEAAFHYSGQSSFSGLQGLRLQDQTAVSARHYSNRHTREFRSCRDRFVPRFLQRESHSMLWKPWATGILVGLNYVCQI